MAYKLTKKKKQLLAKLRRISGGRTKKYSLPDIYEMKSTFGTKMTKVLPKFGINWAGMGTKSAATTASFGKSLMKASSLAKELNKAKITGIDKEEFDRLYDWRSGKRRKKPFPQDWDPLTGEYIGKR